MVDVQQTVPATLNYAPPGHSPYPASICTSVNHVVCHGIPGDKKLKDGDIVNIDVTVIKDGWHGDTSRMFYVGDAVDPGAAPRATSPTRRCGAASARCSRARTSATSAHAIQTLRRGPTASRWCASSAATASAGSFHEEPQVLHYGRPAPGSSCSRA